MNFKKFIKNPKTYFKVARKRVVNLTRTVIFRGSNVSCEICGWKGTTFFDGHCPKCNSLPRTRLIPFSLKHFNLTNNEPKILHIAPNVNEYNYIKMHVTPSANYDRLNIRHVSHINIVQDLTQTNLDSHQYELAIAWHVLEHIPQDVKAIAEVYRLLKPGGSFLVSVPIYPIGNKTTFEDSDIPYADFDAVHGHYDHCRSCGLDYYKRFETLGFRTQELKVDHLDEATITYYGLRVDHVVWCFTK
jgi:SAM-dependent methyltransferase